MRKPSIAIKTGARNYSGLVNLASRVVGSLTGSIPFGAPVPGLPAVTTAATDVTAAIGVWGQVGNRGSHADLVDLRSKALTLWQMLNALAEYVSNTAQVASGNNYTAMAELMNSSGFQLRGENSPQGVLEKVQNFRVVVSKKTNRNQVLLDWKKPLNVTTRSNVKSYMVYRGTTPVFSAAMLLTVIAKSKFVDTNDTTTPVTWFYWVVPIGAAGMGVVSDGVSATVPGA